MTRRPSAHVLEDQSRDRLTQFFHDHGWTVESIKRDYGEDLLVRIFDEERASPLFFFVQAKAFSNVERLLIQGGSYLSVPVAPEHLDLWCEFSEPVFLTVWDALNDVTYWECVQTAVAIDSRGRSSRAPVKTRIWVPAVNVLNGAALRRIRTRTQSRYNRYVRESNAAKFLITVLKDQLGLKIEYDPQYGILQVPEGTFIPDVAAGPRVYPFGRFARDLSEIATRLGGSTPEEAFNQVMGNMLSVLRGVADGKVIDVRGPQGEILQTFRSPADIKADFISMLESSDED